jgi:hypothetical protein
MPVSDATIASLAAMGKFPILLLASRINGNQSLIDVCNDEDFSIIN